MHDDDSRNLKGNITLNAIRSFYISNGEAMQPLFDHGWPISACMAKLPGPVITASLKELAMYQYKFSSRSWVYFVMLIFAVVTGGPCLVFALDRLFRNAFESRHAFLLLYGTLAAGVASYLLYGFYRNFKWTATVSADGISWTSPTESVTIAREEIKNIVIDNRMETPYVTVNTKNGTNHNLPTQCAMYSTALAQAIQREMSDIEVVRK